MSIRSWEVGIWQRPSLRVRVGREGCKQWMSSRGSLRNEPWRKFMIISYLRLFNDGLPSRRSGSPCMNMGPDSAAGVESCSQRRADYNYRGGWTEVKLGWMRPFSHPSLPHFRLPFYLCIIASVTVEQSVRSCQCELSFYRSSV